MSPDSTDQPHSTAVEQLQAFGLSLYAARTFVALTGLEDGTAQDVSDVTEVPRTRVYDAVEELSERGLVDVQQSTPKRFWAISSDTVGGLFDHEYSRRVRTLVEALDAVEPVTRSEEQHGVWTVTGTETVSERVIDIVRMADEEVVYMTVEPLLSEEFVEQLRAASERGVSVRLGAMSDAVEERIRGEVPDVETFDSLWVWSDTPAGRLLMVDEDKTLVSVLAPEEEGSRAGRQEETAIWGTGTTNSLVVVLKTMFTLQLDGTQDRDEEQ